jgi:hypothetical protein
MQKKCTIEVCNEEIFFTKSNFKPLEVERIYDATELLPKNCHIQWAYIKLI